MWATVYSYVSADGRNPFREWALGLGKVERAKLNSKIDLLTVCGADLPPNLLSDSGHPNIKKLRINGAVALRPLLCRGPTEMNGSEFTLLAGAIEKDRKLPTDVLELAARRRTEIIENNDRRILHERIR